MPRPDVTRLPDATKRSRNMLVAGKAQSLCPRPAYKHLVARICLQILAEQINISKVNLL
jgi:hypothetical protein